MPTITTTTITTTTTASDAYNIVNPAGEQYPNNKLWLTKDITLIINEKRHVINWHDRVPLKVLAKEGDERDNKIYK